MRNVQVRWRSFWLARRLRRSPDPLREFIYLDEVSVYSLLASKSGAIPSDFTDKATRTVTAELSGVGESSSPAGKLGGAFKAGATHAAERQVVRKAIVQSTFRDLRNGMRNETLFVTHDGRKRRKSPSDEIQLAERLELAKLDGMACKVEDLDRGRLFELTVELEAHDLFRAGTVVDVMTEILDELPAGLRPSIPGIDNATAMGKILDKLLVGLVPLRCRVVDYSLVEVVGNEWIVHNDLLQSIPDATPRRAIHVVGVTEQQLYWRDLRRVAFSRLPVRAMARVAVPGICDEWSPVKLSDAVSRFSPDFATSVRNLETIMQETGMQGSSATERQDRFQAGLIAHAAAYADLLAYSFDAAALAVNATARQYRSAASGDFDLQTQALEQVEAQVRESHQNSTPQEVGRAQLLQLRQRTLSRIEEEEQASRAASAQSPIEQNYIECEFVALYW